MQHVPRLYAVVPAAGVSRRMGRPKLLLPLGGRTVIARLLEALDRAGIVDRVVVVRPDDNDLAAEASAAGATVVRPAVSPPDMRSSVEYALAEILRKHAPAAKDGWLLVPGDHPVLNAEVLDRLIAEWRRRDGRILVPTCQGRRGHPTFFRWDLCDEIAAIPPDQGLNRLLRSDPGRVVEVAVDDPAVLTDLDTPADYEALQRQFA